MVSDHNDAPRPPNTQGLPPAVPVPPIENWDRAPWNRWSFQHVRELLPTIEVWRGSGPVHVLPRKEQALDDLPVAGLDGEIVPLSRHFWSRPSRMECWC